MLGENASFTAAAEKKAAGGSKDEPFTIKHVFDDGASATFLVTDNPAKVQGMNWENLAAVFVQGASWQFKGWPFKDEAAIFAKAAGFFVRYSHERPNQTVKGWQVPIAPLCMWRLRRPYVSWPHLPLIRQVTPLAFSMEKTRTHEVSVMMVNFWEVVHKHIASKKPILLAKAADRI